MCFFRLFPMLKFQTSFPCQSKGVSCKDPGLQLFKQSQWECSGGGQRRKGTLAGGEESSGETDREGRYRAEACGWGFYPPSSLHLGPDLSTQTVERTLMWKVGCNLSTLNCTEPAAWAPSSALLGHAEDQTYPDNFPRRPHLCPVYYFSLPAISFPSNKYLLHWKNVALFLYHSELSYSYLNHVKMTPILNHLAPCTYTILEGEVVYASFQGHQEIKPHPHLLSLFILPEPVQRHFLEKIGLNFLEVFC